MKTTTVYLGIGSNIGDREDNLRYAVRLLAERVNIEKLSPFYDTAPVGNLDQTRFLNAVCKGRTTLPPQDLLAFLKEIEQRMGRITAPSSSPRPIDIDILFYGNLTINTAVLTIPHPRLMERVFVLAPLADIAPRVKHPVIGKTIKHLLNELQRKTDDAVRIDEEGPCLK
jgi:2-amino-4-hydroxy-6-hydroxymethyldihydropteridine diphosphokinase